MANLITISRFPLLIAIIIMQYASSPGARLISVALIVLLILMDMFDGMIARKRHEESLLGSVLDIMTDRSVELVMWIVFGHLGLVPIVIPIIFVLRGTIVDALRSVSVSEGTAPFKAMKSKLGRFLVGSPWMRSPYGVFKAIAFAGLALTHALAAYAARGQVSTALVGYSRTLFNVVSWIATAYCLVRGVPVVIEVLPTLLERTSEDVEAA